MNEYHFSSRKWYLNAIHETVRYWTEHPFQADELFAYYDLEDLRFNRDPSDTKRSTSFIVPRGEVEPKLVGTDLNQNIDLEFRIKFIKSFDEIQSFDSNFPNDNLKDVFKFRNWVDQKVEPIYSSKKKKEKK